MTFKATAEAPREGAKQPDSAATDRQLAEDFLKGAPAAVDQISLWVRQAAWRYRSRLPAEWDDLFQDLLLEVTLVLREDGFRGESSLRTFVSRIAHYRCLNRLRDLARRPESELDEQHAHVPDPARSVIDRLLEYESEDLLKRFLRSVSEDCRRLWEAILAERSYREMSRELGVSAGALRVRVLRCRQKAVAQWKEWLDSPKR
ncbi:MAG: sigma-70 family RNA polymerase sigma factor [Acidobacteriota bacterium]